MLLENTERYSSIYNIRGNIVFKSLLFLFIIIILSDDIVEIITGTLIVNYNQVYAMIDEINAVMKCYSMIMKE